MKTTVYNNSSLKCTISFRPCNNNKMYHLHHQPICTINLLPMPYHNSSTLCLPIPTACILPCLCGNSHSIMLPTLISSKRELAINIAEEPNVNANNSSTSTSISTINSINTKTSPSPTSTVELMVDATILVLIANIQHRVIRTKQPSKTKWKITQTTAVDGVGWK
eukprot:1462415-Ditylum_brightwellii.AAC.1